MLKSKGKVLAKANVADLRRSTLVPRRERETQPGQITWNIPMLGRKWEESFNKDKLPGASGE